MCKGGATPATLDYQLIRRRRTITLAQTDHQNFLLKKSGLERCIGYINIYERVAPGRALGTHVRTEGALSYIFFKIDGILQHGVCLSMNKSTYCAWIEKG